MPLIHGVKQTNETICACLDIFKKISNSQQAQLQLFFCVTGSLEKQAGGLECKPRIDIFFYRIFNFVCGQRSPSDEGFMSKAERLPVIKSCHLTRRELFSQEHPACAVSPKLRVASQLCEVRRL